MAVPAENLSFTFADYLNWDTGDMVELIDGQAVQRNTPSTKHQLIVMEISRQLANFLLGKPCKVFSAPYAVRLFEKEGDAPEDVQTVVQPDLLVVCDENKLDDSGCRGAPDLTVEVLSPSTVRHDRLIKYDLYQRAGVREYWIVSPEEKSVQVFVQNGVSLAMREFYTQRDVAKVNVLEGCFIELEKVFAE